MTVDQPIANGVNLTHETMATAADHCYCTEEA